MNVYAWIFVVLAVMLVWAFFVRWVEANPRGDFLTGLIYRGMQLHSRLLHRLRVEGRENIPCGSGRAGPDVSAGPLLIIANHTAGVDPSLIQASLRFEVRWMMAKDMMLKDVDFFWDYARIIAVDRGGRDLGAAREAIRHLKQKGVIGIFPEGGIERPPRRLIPFLPGVGLIVAKSGAPVVPVLIEDTPPCPTAWGSLYTPGRAKISFLPMMRFDAKTSPEAITRELQRVFEDRTGWPIGERTPVTQE
jgi:1-acyl-sn-glycerol-3-phosphate acyltransferase